MVADHKVRIIILGESGVGKTSLMIRFCKNIFREAHAYTSIDYYSKTILLNEKTVELELWDTAGQERFRSIIKEYFRKADGALLVYDTTNPETFSKLSNWLKELKKVKEEATIVVVGSKADLSIQHKVSRSEAEVYAREQDSDFFETSAKNNENVDEVFKNLVLKILERKRIPSFSKELVTEEVKIEDSDKSPVCNGKVEPECSATDSSKQITEGNSLPPIIRLEDNLGNDIHRIKLTMEKPKQKQKGCC